jgi:hypothetical protein
MEEAGMCTIALYGDVADNTFPIHLVDENHQREEHVLDFWKFLNFLESRLLPRTTCPSRLRRIVATLKEVDTDRVIVTGRIGCMEAIIQHALVRVGEELKVLCNRYPDCAAFVQEGINYTFGKSLASKVYRVEFQVDSDDPAELSRTESIPATTTISDQGKSIVTVPAIPTDAYGREEICSLRLLPNLEDLQCRYEGEVQEVFSKHSSLITRADWTGCRHGHQCRSIMLVRTLLLEAVFINNYEAGLYAHLEGRWLCLISPTDREIHDFDTCEEASAFGRKAKVYPPTFFVQKIGAVCRLLPTEVERYRPELEPTGYLNAVAAYG